MAIHELNPTQTESFCKEAYRKFHEERRQRLLDYIEARVAEHVADGGNDVSHYRNECAINGMMNLQGHNDKDVWNAAWKACEEHNKI
jgi:hypothetical protein